MAEKSLRELDLAVLLANTRYFPSPAHWEDEIIYFLMVDRFSDGNENQFRDNQGNLVNTGTTPLFKASDNANAVQTEADSAKWRDAGTRFVGGTLAGLQAKLGYLKRLGVSTVWLSPVFKQVSVDNTYHGYGIQHFLDVDAHFGTRDELRQLVQAAHALGIRVILDIILNHTGDVFRYAADNPSWNGQQFPVAGYRDALGAPVIPFATVDLNRQPGAFPEAAVWPSEFQSPEAFTQEGHINNFDFFPEYADGDFFTLKDLHHGTRIVNDGVDQIDQYVPSSTLLQLCQVFKFWIAFADLDGYRLDTAKHIDPGAARFFAGVIHDFAEAIGKDNFYIIGEITGGRDFAFDRLEVTGLDAALGISDERVKMTGLVKGDINPFGFFDLFRNSLLVRKNSHVWFRDKVVTSVDDHDHVDQGTSKHRFSAGGYGNLNIAVMALNATTLGIPCIYYGTEQGFDGAGDGDSSDRYIREAMFGGEFGPFRTRDRHFFDESQSVYKAMADIHRVRRDHLTLRRGRQYLRQISGNGVDFGYPERPNARMLSVVAWSRIFNDNELLCAINTDPLSPRTAFVTIDNDLHSTGDSLTCIYSTASGETGHTITVQAKNGKAVLLEVPAGGFVIYG